MGSKQAWLFLLALSLVAGCGADSAEDASGELLAVDHSEGGDTVENALIGRVRQPLFGDLPEMRERGAISVLVSYGKTNFFYDGGTARGFEYELIKLWDEQLNKGRKTGERTHVVFLPTPFERLIDDLLAGKGDVVAAGLTVTPERAERVSFTRPYISGVQEVVVSHRGGFTPTALEDLQDRRVVVRKGSSYASHLEELSARLEGDVEVVQADRRLVTEDLLELVNSGAVELTVADEHIADAWSGVLPDLQIHSDLSVHDGGEIAWAVRPESAKLLAHLNEFLGTHRKGTLLGNVLLKRYFANSRWIANPLEPDQIEKLNQLVDIFQKYAEEYDFDWLALAAQSYQESKLDQAMRSPAGAIGVMQLLQSTAADPWVSIQDIEEVENNIHAGAKYLDFLRDRYFSDDEIDPLAQVDFAWAAYNAGPARVRRMRARAAERGLDPDRWFGHVERIAAEEIGRETVDYVANINKYYLAYRLQYDANVARTEARAAMD
jgi:membrane-bound lytic murein transglycosylase MltF